MPQIRELQKGFNPLPFQTKEETDASKEIETEISVSIHFLFKQRKKPKITRTMIARKMFQSTSFSNKGRNIHHITAKNTTGVSIHFLFKQRKKHANGYNAESAKMFQSTSFSNKGRNWINCVSAFSMVSFNPLPFQTKEETKNLVSVFGILVSFNPLPFQTKEETTHLGTQVKRI
ncbi:hypothetical protein LEP1GSC021_3345 [Leptospira noguchii str. 1993005606]|nr:hypothetical protein LEP1GSC021_3345 [Leptospira noguchii str. 1993005606]